MVDSWMFIGGYLVQFGGNALILGQIIRQKSIYGLSMETQVMYLLSTISRCVWSRDTRLTETPIAYLELCASLTLSVLLVVCAWMYRHTAAGASKGAADGAAARSGADPNGPYAAVGDHMAISESKKRQGPRFDLFQIWRKGNDQLTALTLTAGAAILAILVHPGSALWTVQILVAFTIYLEAVALVPQLRMMKRMVEIEPLTSRSVMLIVLSRIVRLGFWCTLFLQNENFLSLFLADLLHCVLCGDFLLTWMKRLRPGASLLLKY